MLYGKEIFLKYKSISWKWMASLSNVLRYGRPLILQVQTDRAELRCRCFVFSERHESDYFSRWARVQAQAAAEILSSVCQVLKFPFPPRRRDILLNNEREPHHSDSDWHFGLYLRLNKAEQVFELGSCLISEYQSCWSYPSGKLGSPNFWLRYWLDQAVLRVLAWRE